MRSAGNQPPRADPAEARGAQSRFTDFASLPGYDELRLQRTVADRMGLENPFFRVHDGRGGARTQIDGRTLINFSGYDYLGLNGHPEVAGAAKAAIDRYGISASASRVVAGERPIHRVLESALAGHYRADDAVVFVSGYATNVSVIAQLLGAKDLVVYDAAIHNSAVVGSVLSGASRRSFVHNDLDNLEQVLAGIRHKFERVLIVVEGLYSMDGDVPDLPRLIDIKKRFNAWLMVDEAHALGVLGRRGYGLFEHFDADPRDVDIWMGTLSKTLAACGGYIAGSSSLVDYIRCMVGAFVYSVGMPPVVAAAAAKALELMYREPERVATLQKNAAHFLDYAKSRKLDTGFAGGTAVTPVVVGDSLGAVILSQELNRRGVNVQPVIYPAVPPKSARLRFFVTAEHTQRDIETTLDIVAEEIARLPERVQALKALA
ncbi:MAG: Palmitoyltransferase-like protein [Pseudolabrys sp.]|jgi:8-amino-7-oxononanoate synthase|nr:Palmitoyltransferase-like protein [Pseudolabrys sp.]